MSVPSVTVFVRRMQGQWVANTSDFAEAQHPNSQETAARKSAALHFGVNEALIEVAPNGPHAWRASLKRPAPCVDWGFLGLGLLITAISALAFFGADYFAGWLGGGR